MANLLQPTQAGLQYFQQFFLSPEHRAVEQKKAVMMNFRSTGEPAVSLRPVAFRPTLADGLALQLLYFVSYLSGA